MNRPTVPQGQRPEGEGVNLDLDRLIARYGRKIAQAELEAEVAVQRAERAEAGLRDLAERLAAVEADATAADDVLDDLDLDDTADEPEEAAA